MGSLRLPRSCCWQWEPPLYAGTAFRETQARVALLGSPGQSSQSCLCTFSLLDPASGHSSMGSLGLLILAPGNTPASVKQSAPMKAD